MLKTVRSRILFFSSFSVFALSALAFLSWSIIGKAQNSAEQLIQNSLTESWLLTDLEQDLRHLQDLSFKTKAQLLLWSEINQQFEVLSQSIPAKLHAIEQNPQLRNWYNESTDLREPLAAYLDELGAGIAEQSYYQAGKTVDFSLFPVLSPLLEKINIRKETSRNHISQDSDELLNYLGRQQVSLISGFIFFLTVIVLMTFWLRKTVIFRLQRIEQDIQAMDKNSDLATPPTLAGSDEVAGVATALIRLVGRFEGFIGDIRNASKIVNERSDHLDSQARELESASRTTHDHIQEVTLSMQAMAEQAFTIETSTHDSTETLRSAVTANAVIQSGLKKSEMAADNTVEVIARVTSSIQELTESTSKIEKVISVIAEIAEQTNLLALNAAIEAARAGEHGRGFAVVADEVRTLSQRTTDSTGQIRQWVHDLIQVVEAVDDQITEMKHAGDGNRHTLNELKEQLATMNHWFADLEQRTTTINQALSMQREEIDRVGLRFATLDNHASTVSETIAGSRAISIALKTEANSMNNLTARFRTSFDS
ncbi:MAG: chemotaxis protein [Methylophaga sp.]|nr:methyl-accepting chemotaxis protein [Methylophaga sp. SB9B]MAK66317.1 chemotaxis protein [Methylophaga sp.]MAY17011.1 chemotaxis protein [Methylophaga sp.]THK42614.1 methyl-accepting chemotaxis protein [Methylophaga sp. SB9B]HAO24438.1 methyl-accepting chemotaxis protein [Methylophaga sp.]